MWQKWNLHQEVEYIYRKLRIVTPALLHNFILYQAHYGIPNVHSGGTWLYDTRWYEYCRIHKGNVAYLTVADCQSFGVQGPQYGPQRQWGTFQPVVDSSLSLGNLSRAVPVGTVAATSATTLLVDTFSYMVRISDVFTSLPWTTVRSKEFCRRSCLFKR